MLKIAGLILLGIIGLFILVCAMLLFIPIRYRLNASNAGSSFRMSWFLGFFRLRYADKAFKATVFWFKRIKLKGKSKQTAKGAKSAKKDKNKEGSLLKTLKSAASYPDKGLLLKCTIRLVKRMLKAIKPRVFRASLDIGTGEPDTTGYLLGFAGILQGMFNLDLSVEGCFEEKLFRYDVLIKDLLYCWPFVWALTAFCVRRPVRAIIKEFMKRDDADERNTKTILRRDIRET
ncbi:MAG: hypothetical protein LBS19_08355 [Clostridiales bacterium]|jgi:hypothetical protein|nr:hypothetical protein [Clostridiales bacterium]